MSGCGETGVRLWGDRCAAVGGTDCCGWGDRLRLWLQVDARLTSGGWRCGWQVCVCDGGVCARRQERVRLSLGCGRLCLAVPGCVRLCLAVLWRAGVS